MNRKNIALSICSLWLLTCPFYASAQTQWTYDFNNGLLPIESGGQSLKILGDPGKFVKEKIPGSGVNGVPELMRTVYEFRKNAGLQFNNATAKNFLSKSYTVEMYFKLDTLDSWKRILDYKNRKSDYGSYIYDGKINFYDYALSEKAPVKAKHYIHYVLSRDVDTKMIRMYINGVEKVEFKDPGTEAMLDHDQVLNFFQDDLVANHESSSGSVALIRLYDRVMTPVFIRRSYQTISKVARQTPDEPEEKVIEEPVVIKTEALKRNPDMVYVSGKVYDGNTLAPAEADVTVNGASGGSAVLTAKTENGSYNLELAPNQSYQIKVEALGYQPKVIPIRTKERATAVKSLVGLSRENYEAPFATLYFNQGNEELDAPSKNTLDSMISYFGKRTDLKIILKGHTDNQGDFNKNLELSNQRVQVVKDYLTTKGVRAERVDGRGYGSAQPKQYDAQLRKANRRVEIWAEPVKR